MEKDIEKFVQDLIWITFDFEPRVKIERGVGRPDSRYDKVFLVYLDGSEEERRQMMGSKAANLYAFRRVTSLYADRIGCRIYLYIYPNVN